ncbi:MAG TPA: branched-chain amino acid transaminase [Candidatus Caldiarchaeum subterraneum]|uniref:Branched-chain-amino-acid aminotransferase n=1 Tax=Caldiarchaeum subterraneum TaxID=311458 RepID=A0A832ZUD5_CALS0|nr:branched-chain amino acid transaminase [Candidatus Caldarchaeum subterraneum]
MLELSEKPSVVWMDGELVPWEEAKVHIMTHALHYGSAVFEGIRAYHHNGELYIFRLKEHMKRLIDSAKILDISAKYSVDQLCEATVRVLRENRFQTSVYIRPIIFVGAGGIGLDFSNNPVQTAIIALPFSKYFAKTGLRVHVSSWRRIPDSSLPPKAKAAANYVNSILATREAKKAGYDEAILLDHHGYVSEGAGENLFLVKDGIISTPPITASILEGITRNSIMTLCRDLGYRVVERMISRTELYTADELFFTGTAAEVQPILEVDGRRIADGNPGRITKQLMELYSRVVIGEEEKYRSWLTPVYSR